MLNNKQKYNRKYSYLAKKFLAKCFSHTYWWHFSLWWEIQKIFERKKCFSSVIASFQKSILHFQSESQDFDLHEKWRRAICDYFAKSFSENLLHTKEAYFLIIYASLMAHKTSDFTNWTWKYQMNKIFTNQTP